MVDVIDLDTGDDSGLIETPEAASGERAQSAPIEGKTAEGKSEAGATRRPRGPRKPRGDDKPASTPPKEAAE